nr:hypothetical protein [uncultured bacterium]
MPKGSLSPYPVRINDQGVIDIFKLELFLFNEELKLDKLVTPIEPARLVYINCLLFIILMV